GSSRPGATDGAGRGPVTAWGRSAAAASTVATNAAPIRAADVQNASLGSTPYSQPPMGDATAAATPVTRANRPYPLASARLGRASPTRAVMTCRKDQNAPRRKKATAMMGNAPADSNRMADAMNAASKPSTTTMGPTAPRNRLRPRPMKTDPR